MLLTTTLNLGPTPRPLHRAAVSPSSPGEHRRETRRDRKGPRGGGPVQEGRRRPRRGVAPELTSLEARAVPTTFSLLSPLSPGPLLSPITPAGGIVIDLLGASGGRIEAQLGPGELHQGAVDSGTPVDLGAKSGFTPSILDTLGGGLAGLAVRVTMNNGGTGPGDPGRNQDVLLINGASLGDFSSVITQQTSPDGLTGLSMNTEGGFRSDSLDTGFFSTTDPELLSQVYATIAGTGSVGFQLLSSGRAGRGIDFVGGLTRELQDASRIPILAINPPVISDVQAESPVEEGSVASIVVSAFNLHGGPGEKLTYQFDPNNDGSFPISIDSGAASVVFDRPGSYVVPIRVYNSEGARASGQALIEVRNVAPVVTSPGSQQAVEGSTANLDLGSFSDPGRDSPWTVVVDWGDGTNPSTFEASQTGDLGSIDHVYARAGVYAAEIHVTDAAGLSGTAEFKTTVTNVAPDVVTPGDQAANVGTSADVRIGSFSDPGRDDPWLVRVNWGDGAPAQTFSLDRTGDLGALPHRYDAAGTYSVTVSVLDLNGTGLTGAGAFRVVVGNVAPKLTSPGDQQAVEGTSAGIDLGSFTDPGRASPWTIVVDWGDGSPPQSYTSTRTGRLDPLEHVFPNAGRFTVQVRLTAASGLYDDASFGVDVANVAPSIRPPVDQSAAEGTPTVFDLGRFSDAGVDAPWTVVVDWGDGGPGRTYQLDQRGSPGALAHTYHVPGRYLVSLEVADSLGLADRATFGVDVTNVAPSAASSGDQTTLEGSPSTFPLGAFADPGGDSPWTVRIAWSDGSDDQIRTIDRPGDLGVVSRVFGVHGVYQATVEVTDALGLRGTSTFLVHVGDVPPVIDAVSFVASIDEGQSGELATTFHDPGFLDRFHVSVDWGDQTTTDFGDGLTGRSYLATHAYGVAGVYHVVVTVVDLAGAAATSGVFVTVNPSATPSPTPTASVFAPPISPPPISSAITPLDFFSSSSAKSQSKSSPAQAKGSGASFDAVLGQGIVKSPPFSKMAGKADGAYGRTLEEILTELLAGRKASIQTASASRGLSAVLAGDLNAPVPIAGPSPTDSETTTAAEPGVLGRTQTQVARKRGKATRVMILVVAWTVSLRNQRRTGLARRYARVGPENPDPAGRSS